MKTLTYSITLPADILIYLNKNIQEFTNEMKLFTSIQLFKDHKLSLGKAAELAQMDKMVFIYNLNQRNIPVIDYEPNELQIELNAFEK
jgi:predicted HTH domain antitoxin